MTCALLRTSGACNRKVISLLRSQPWGLKNNRAQRAVKIIILGAGQVGGTLAEHLANEQQDITLVDTDMLVAVTNSDWINMMACQVAHTPFKTPTKICRVRSPNYLAHQEQLFSRELIPVDVGIGPEQLVTQNIQRLIANPGALQVLDFAEGRVQLVAVRAYHDGPNVSAVPAAICGSFHTRSGFPESAWLPVLSSLQERLSQSVYRGDSRSYACGRQS